MKNSEGIRRKRITAVRLSALGDIAMTVPAVKLLAENYPDADITYITDARFTGLFDPKPANLTVVGLPKDKLKGVRAIPALFRAIRQSRPDIVVDMHNVFKTTVPVVLFKLLGKKTAILPKRRGERTAILAGKKVAEPFTERYLKLFEKTGFPIRQEYSKTRNTGKTIKVGIAPFARYSTKTYPVELMEQVVELLVAEGAEIYLFGGGKKEIEVLASWRSKWGDSVKYVSGSMSLSEEIDLMGTLNVMLSMDSANMHLASLRGTRVVSIWGGTVPACGFLGWGQSESDAIVTGLDCQPCSIAGTATCPKGKDMECLRTISPQRIVEKILNK